MTSLAFTPPQRILMGPGPSDAPPSVLEAMSRRLVGHLDPSFVDMMEEIKSMLREVFLTKNEMTFPVSGTGSAGMEFCFVNLIEPGDEVVIGINGVFGMRMADVAERCGAKVTKVEAKWGCIIEPEQISEALKGKRPKLVAIVHAETSTGARCSGPCSARKISPRTSVRRCNRIRLPMSSASWSSAMARSRS